MKLPRGAVPDFLRSASEIEPTLVSPEKASPHRDQILEPYVRCQGNLVRVHEELTASGTRLSYWALTAFCRRQGIGHEPKEPMGEYQFPPDRPRDATNARQPRWSSSKFVKHPSGV